jgi:hypothetical protein
MFQAASTAKSGDELRRRILDYLEQSEWDERLDHVRSAQLSVEAFEPLLNDLVSPNDAGALRGAVGRMLTSYPDITVMHLVRAFAEALCADSNAEVVAENVKAASTFAVSSFGQALICRSGWLLPPARFGKAEGGEARFILPCGGGGSWPVTVERAATLPIELATGPAEHLNKASSTALR